MLNSGRTCPLSSKALNSCNRCRSQRRTSRPPWLNTARAPGIPKSPYSFQASWQCTCQQTARTARPRHNRGTLYTEHLFWPRRPHRHVCCTFPGGGIPPGHSNRRPCRSTQPLHFDKNPRRGSAQAPLLAWGCSLEPPGNPRPGQMQGRCLLRNTYSSSQRFPLFLQRSEIVQASDLEQSTSFRGRHPPSPRMQSPSLVQSFEQSASDNLPQRYWAVISVQ